MFGWACLAAWGAMAAAWFLGVRRVPTLTGASAGRLLPGFPSVSVVVAARNEEAALERALSSVLAQDYPDLEVIAVDDRSTDRTGEILDGLAAADPRLRVLHLGELPPGWLGKNHALWQGARRARGEWLLFTDADVGFAPRCLGRAVAYARARRLDHLALVPRLAVEGLWLRALVVAFAVLFFLYTRPWRVANPRARESLGVGAFNLVRRRVYEDVGTHRALAARVDDDLALGRRIKASGFRQGVAWASELIAVEWYTGVGQAIRGLEKNALAPFGFRAGPALGAAALAIAVHVAPPLVLLLSPAGGSWALVGAVALLFAVAGDGARRAGLPGAYGLLHPVGTAILLWAIVRAAGKAALRGELEWRGTRYPVSWLRKGGAGPP
ncbi:MAG: glycosyltransferase family 2 protein [Deferrisomatales bacterium]